MLLTTDKYPTIIKESISQLNKTAFRGLFLKGIDTSFIPQ